MKPKKISLFKMWKLKKKIPKIPKKRLYKEEIQYRQAIRRARVENIGLALITIFFLAMAIAGIMAIYLMWNYKW